MNLFNYIYACLIGIIASCSLILGVAYIMAGWTPICTRIALVLSVACAAGICLTMKKD